MLGIIAGAAAGLTGGILLTCFAKALRTKLKLTAAGEGAVTYKPGLRLEISSEELSFEMKRRGWAMGNTYPSARELENLIRNVARNLDDTELESAFWAAGRIVLVKHPDLAGSYDVALIVGDVDSEYPWEPEVEEEEEVA